MRVSACSAYGIVACAFVLGSSSAWTQVKPPNSDKKMEKSALITPDEWLKRQPKPIFRAGHTLPRLTRFGWSLSLPTRIELTENWNYGLEYGGYLTDENVRNALTNPSCDEAKMVSLSASNPKKYPLAVILSRDEPPTPAPDTFLRDASGKLIAGNAYSILNPQSVIDQMAALRARPLAALRAKTPVDMILNGGEYGLGVLGFMKQHAVKDPKLVAYIGKQDWFDQLSKAKGRESVTIAKAVRKAAPDRKLYIYYNSGNTDRNRYGGWSDWGYDWQYAQEHSDLPSGEHYYKGFNSGWMPDAGSNDILTRAFNAIGYQLKYGKKYTYDWLCSGWIEDAPPAKQVAPPGTHELSNGNAAALVDPNGGQMGRIDLYTGFLKCLFTMGSLGGNAGYYSLPTGGFGAKFPADSPPNWIRQMVALSHVQSLFSYLEPLEMSSDLLTGPNKHVWSKDQPAYEFPTGSPGVRVLARKQAKKPVWLVAAWAADANDRAVKVKIPGLGELMLQARGAGSIYVVKRLNGSLQIQQVDSNALAPTVKGFRATTISQ